MEAQFNNEPTLQADLRQYIALIWRWSWLIILATLLAGGAAYITSIFQDPVYQATTTLLINEAPSAQTSDYTAILTSERLARTYSEMLTKRPVLEEVIHNLDLATEYEELEDLQGTIEVQLVRDTQLIELSVEDTDPAQAALIANTIVSIFADQNQALQASRFIESKASLEEQLTRVDGQIHNTMVTMEDLGDDAREETEYARLETELAQYRQTYSQLLQSYEQIRVAEAQATSNVVQVEPAIIPENPIRPRVLMNTALAAVVGGMLAVGAIFLMEALDDTIKSPEEVSRHLDLPVLGTIIRHETEDGLPITMGSPRSPTAEAFRSLRTNIQYASVDYPIRSLLVTSPAAGVGKSTITANLGVVLAQGGSRAVVVDADMRRPTQHKLLSLPNRLGLSSLFVFQSLFEKTEQLPEGSLQTTKTEGLSVVTSGKTPPNPSELLASERMSNILDRLKNESEIVIVDSPPIIAVTDATVLAPRVDGVLIVIKPGQTKLETAIQTVQQLRRVGANIVGIVINEVNPRSGRYGYYYRYDQEYYASAEMDGDGLPSGTIRGGWRRALWGGLAALVVLLGGWLGYSLISGQDALALLPGGGSPTPSPTSKAAIAFALTQTGEAVEVYQQANPTATTKPTDVPEPSATSEPTVSDEPELADTQVSQGEVVATPTEAPTLEPTNTPTITPTFPPPTPGPGFETPFGSQGEYLLHQVKFGDNLPNLAKQYQTDRDVIVAANGLIPNQSLQPDQVIVILPGRTDSLDVIHLSVLFLEEDTQIGDLASRNGVTSEEIRRYSNLGPNDLIPGGRWLIFPKRDVTPTVTLTAIPTPDLSEALTDPFGPNDAYILHKVKSGDSMPILEKLYLTSSNVIYAANDVEGSLQLGDVLVILPERRDASGINQFAVHYVPEDLLVEELSAELGVLMADIVFHNDLNVGEMISAGQWIIYPASPAE